ncbi:MAG: aquaporin [Candidatus Nomurabacteria bacterium]|jgi:glycerol uptake facilitator-like aquaporin|nr:aquaporin [Candidatus Nomurabacteria bacterium]
MATKKAKTNRTAGGAKKTTNKSTKTVTKTVTKVASKEPVREATVITAKPAATGAKEAVKYFFRKKYDSNEGILTIFKTPKIIGAIAGEIIGAFLLTLLFIALGFYQPLYLMFAIVGITMAVYPLSGANINPLVTIGLMASRRISVIRGVFYIFAQLIGAMLAWLVMQSFVNGAGELAPTLTKLSAITEDSNLWGIVAIEAIGAAIIAFFFARALKFKRSAWTFASVIGAGFVSALLFAIVISSNFFQIDGGFAINPALAIALEAFTVEGTNALQVLLAYIAAPIVAGVVGFYLSDLADQVSGDACACGSNTCNCK